MHVDCAGSHKTVSPEVSPTIFPVDFCAKWLWWHVHVHVDCAGSHATRHLNQKFCQWPRGSLDRDLAKRPLMEILFRDLAKRPLAEILYKDLARRPLRDHIQRPGEDSSDLAQRSFLEILNRDLTLRFPYRDLLWRSLIERSLQESCQETSSRDPVQRSCQDTSFGDLVQRHCIEICCRDLAKRSLT